MDEMIKRVAYKNGTIRDGSGKLVAFFDEDTNTLMIDGDPHVYHVVDLEHAMDVIEEKTATVV